MENYSPDILAKSVAIFEDEKEGWQEDAVTAAIRKRFQQKDIQSVFKSTVLPFELLDKIEAGIYDSASAIASIRKKLSQLDQSLLDENKMQEFLTMKQKYDSLNFGHSILNTASVLAILAALFVFFQYNLRIVREAGWINITEIDLAKYETAYIYVFIAGAMGGRLAEEIMKRVIQPLNKKLDFNIASFVKEFESLNSDIHIGVPMDPEWGFFDAEIEKISDALGFSEDRTYLLAEAHLVKSKIERLMTQEADKRNTKLTTA